MDKNWKSFKNIGIGLLIVSNLFMYSKLSNIRDDIISLKIDTSSLYSHISDEVSRISSNIETALKTQSSIINEFEYEFGAIKDENYDYEFEDDFYENRKTIIFK